MRRLASLVMCMLIVMIAGTPLVAPGARAQDATSDDEATFTELMEAAQANPSLAGPFEGEIPHDEETVIISRAEVEVTDLAAHVRFSNPYPTSDADWDYGLEFRLTDETHYRLYVTSRGEWNVTLGASELIADGTVDNLDTTRRGGNDIDLVVSGDEAYFAVNGEFIAAVDVSAHQEPGDVAVGTAFLENDFIAGEATPFEEFEVWPLESAPAETPTEPAADPTATEPVAEPTATEPVAALTPTQAAVETPVTTPGATPAAETGFFSETYNVALTWEAPWTEVERSSQDGYDYLRITNGISTVDIYAYGATETPAACVEAELGVFQQSEGYADVRFATGADGEPVREERDGQASGRILFTFTGEDGTPTAFAAHVECRSIVPGESMFMLIQYVAEDQIEAETPARERLLSTLRIGEQAQAIVTPTSGPAPTEAATSTEPAGAPAVLRLEAAGGADIDALVTLTPDGDRTTVAILALGAEPGTLALVQQGSCADLDPAPAYLLRDLDDSGRSETTISAALDDLRGGYAITLHADVSDLTRPLACGDIPA